MNPNNQQILALIQNYKTYIFKKKMQDEVFVEIFEQGENFKKNKV